MVKLKVFRIALICSLIIIFMAKMPVFAQQSDYIQIIKELPAETKFETVQTSVEKYFNRFDTEANKNKNGYKLWKRWEWFANQHIDTDGRVGSWTIKSEEALLAVNSLPALNNVNGGWSSAGPGSISNGENFLGRVECVAFHPTDPNTLYAGSGTGGLWRTNNLGGTWTALTDNLPSLSIASVVVQQNNPNIIYILTGDGDGGTNWGYYVKERSSGVFKSTDGGTTWNTTGLNWNRSDAERYGFKLIQSPTNTNILMAATSNGIWRTTDGGNNWIQELTGEYSDIIFAPNNASRVAAIPYASSVLRISTNGGADWTNKTIPSSGLGTTRSMLAVTPAATNNVYIMMGRQGDSTIRGYYRYSWSGDNFTLITNTPNIFGNASNGSGTGGFPWWAIAVAVSPLNSNIHLAGGVIGRRSTNGGVDWTAAHPAAMHADLHGYYYHPSGTAVYCAHDGGISRSSDNGVTWTNITTGMRINQYYRISTTPQNVNAVLGGTQDNGHHVRYSNTSAFKWTLTCCDGMDNAIDYTNDQIIYMCTQDGGLNRSTNGGDTWSYISPIRTGTTRETSSWVAPIKLHTTNPTTIFYAGNTGIWRSTNSGLSNWVNIGADGRGAMAQGTSFNSRMYASGANTTLRMSSNINDASPTWTTISGNLGWPALANLSGSTITGIAVNPDNSSEIWVCFSGYNATTKVYRSINAGNTWQNQTLSLPNVPVHTIAFQDQGANNGAYQIYIGTDIGVFYKSNSSANWGYFSNGLPRVMVTDLEITNNYLYAGTYGRGIWRTLVYDNCPTNASYSATYNSERVFQASGTINTTITVSGTLGANVWMQAGDYVQLNAGFEAKAGGIFTAKAAPCGAVLLPEMQAILPKEEEEVPK